ncbi:MAG: hypothetical protein ACJATO_003081, partial [Arenicella sp.]
NRALYSLLSKPLYRLWLGIGRFQAFVVYSILVINSQFGIRYRPWIKKF